MSLLLLLLRLLRLVLATRSGEHLRACRAGDLRYSAAKVFKAGRESEKFAAGFRFLLDDFRTGDLSDNSSEAAFGKESEG